MYTLFKKVGAKSFVAAEVPSMGLSLFIAEEFYKFGSFTLECGLFLSTWYVASFLLDKITFLKPGRTGDVH